MMRHRLRLPPSYFNSRPSARGDRMEEPMNYKKQISIHAPPRGATEATSSRTSRRRFQFTPLREGRPDKQRRARAATTFQFTPLREGRHARILQSGANLVISIHAPPRGATRDAVRPPHARHISIHAPPRGATGSAMRRTDAHVLFQFTPLREGRQIPAHRLCTSHKNFNSRPSARGDSRNAQFPNSQFYFNSRPSARGDRVALKRRAKLLNFNSRPSARGDGGGLVGRQVRDDFNSRPSARGDSPGKISLHAFLISIHAPPRGATCLVNRYAVVRKISIHAPPRGATRTVTIFFVIRLISIHAPPRGATRRGANRHRGASNFNSRPSARGDQIVSAFSHSCLSFQFTPLREGRQRSGRDEMLANAFQFTPLREGRRVLVTMCIIHRSISIHAPPRGATGYTRATSWIQSNFNSRPSARGDPDIANDWLQETLISIHAPPRGATAAHIE